MDYLNYIILFFVPLLAGFSVFILRQDRLKKWVEYIKLFGASFFLGVIVLHLLPEVFHHQSTYIGLFIGLGFFTQVLVEAFTGSEPHDHVLPDSSAGYSTGLLIGLAIHSFFEGLPLSGSYEIIHDHHVHLEHSYLIGVLLHKIPVIIVLVLMMLSSGLTRRSAIVQIIIFSLMTPLGMLAGEIITPGTDWSIYILAFVVGSISHIAMHLIVSREVGDGSNWNIALKIVLMVMGFLAVVLL